jgi:hypothetical protein
MACWRLPAAAAHPLSVSRLVSCRYSRDHFLTAQRGRFALSKAAGTVF